MKPIIFFCIPIFFAGCASLHSEIPPEAQNMPQIDTQNTPQESSIEYSPIVPSLSSGATETASGGPDQQYHPETQITSKQGPCISTPHITFFMYHYVRDDDPRDTPTIRDLSVTPANFRTHMQMVSTLSASGSIHLMQGEDFIQAWKTRCFPHQHIWIFTSDDGWKDTATELAPIAREYRVPFFFGIIAPKVGTPGFISQDELTSLSADPLFTIASHSLTHREMHRISVADEHKEICNSKAELEAMIHTPIDTFVYPVGKIGKKSVEYLKECGYTLAWSTGFGKMLDWNHLEPYILNRVRIHHDTGPKMFLHRAPK